MIDKNYYFFIGTDAELIKLFPVLHEFKKRKIKFQIIASGQNDISRSPLLKYLGIKPQITLSKQVFNEKPVEHFFWAAKTFFFGLPKLRDQFGKINKKNSFLIIHGDTVSTVMGAVYGRLFGLQVVHVEAGLRSFNYLSPFPEEIDRVLASHLAKIHFSPNEWAFNNLSKNIEKINTKANTLYETYEFFTKEASEGDLPKELIEKRYFVLVFHRQENLLQKELFLKTLNLILDGTRKYTCVFVMHKPTRKLLEEEGIFETLKQNKNIFFVDRLDYPDFLNVLKNAEFFITDGGSNQEEAYYMGKPCLLLRKRTERIEGLGENVILSNMDQQLIADFIENYSIYERDSLKTNVSPSKIIFEYLQNHE